MLGYRGSARLTRRIDRGIKLFLGGAAPLLVLSGGGTGPVPEAEIMRQMALARGVPEAALLVEPESRDTVENAWQAARLLRPRGGRKVLLVSDRAHLPRAALLFRLAGLRVAGWVGVPPPSIRWEIAAIVRECGHYRGAWLGLFCANSLRSVDMAGEPQTTGSPRATFAPRTVITQMWFSRSSGPLWAASSSVNRRRPA